VPAEGEALAIASEALVRLALLEGVSFADATPGRFAVDLEGEVWFLDPTEAFALDPERVRGMAEVWAGVRRGDVDAVIRALPLMGGSLPSDGRVLQRELRDTLGSLGGPLWAEHPIVQLRDRSLEALRLGGATLPDEVARLADALVGAEALGRAADPDPAAGVRRGASGTEEPATVAAFGAAREAIGRYRDPRQVVERTVGKLAQGDAYADYPRQVHTLLNELKDGEVEIAFHHAGLDELVSKVDVLANRLVFALLIAALLMGSTMLGIFSDAGIRILGVSVFGLAGFVLAAALGVALLVGIIRSGRL
jgi:ubiquinone biosynthesis protein